MVHYTPRGESFAPRAFLAAPPVAAAAAASRGGNEAPATAAFARCELVVDSVVERRDARDSSTVYGDGLLDQRCVCVCERKTIGSEIR